MAIKIYEKFAPRANPADGDHPYGSIKNESVPGAKDGTPLDAEWGNDYAGFDAALLAEAGIVPSGNADTVVESQRLDALHALFDTYGTVASLAAGKHPVGARVALTDRATGVFLIESGGVVNGYDIIDAGGGDTARLVSHFHTLFINPEWLGMTTSSPDASIYVNHAFTIMNNIVMPSGVFNHLTDINFSSKKMLTGTGATTLNIAAESINLVNMLSCLYCVIKDIDITFSVDNSTAIKLHSNGGSATQLNKFYNVNVEGNLRSGTLSVLFESVAFSNQFYSCNFFRTFDGVMFGEVGVPNNAVNANHFYGCEVRSVNDNANSNRAVTCRGGDNNGFFGGIIENWREANRIDGGSFFCDGTYLEAFASASAFEQYGGSLKLHKCFRQNSVIIFGGDSCSIVDPDLVPTPAWIGTFPMVQFRADTNCRLRIQADIDSSDAFLVRAGQWRDGSGVWAYRSSANIRERIQWMQTQFMLRLDVDKLNVTGDGTVYTIDFGNNKEFDYGGETDTNGIFTPKQNGIFQFNSNITLAGLGDGDSVTAWIETSNHKYYMYRGKVSTNMLQAGQFTLGSAFTARMEFSDTAVVKVQVNKAVPALTVGVIRGNAVDAYTSFGGFIQ